MPDKYAEQIESTRKAGGIVDASYFRNPEARKSLSGLLKQDQAKAAAANPMSAAEQEAQRRQMATPKQSVIKGYKRGGMVKRTGPALLHKGERVLTKRQAKSHKGSY